jgi:hypothetical protein
MSNLAPPKKSVTSRTFGVRGTLTATARARASRIQKMQAGYRLFGNDPPAAVRPQSQCAAIAMCCEHNVLQTQRAASSLHCKFIALQTLCRFGRQNGTVMLS